eukprot:12897598-Prorocentrum_lima.AAC.1
MAAKGVGVAGEGVHCRCCSHFLLKGGWEAAGGEAMTSPSEAGEGRKRRRISQSRAGAVLEH